MKYVIATHNAHKLIELQRILEPLGIEAVTDRDLGMELPEVEETGTTFAENAYLKAASACAATGLPAIADDSGLVVDALDGAPGVYSARYGGEEATDDDRNVLLLEEMKDVPVGERAARFVSAICGVFPNGDILRTQGTFEGEIAFAPKGENGFGYDPIFLVGERTSAEMSPAEKDAVSHRGKALAAFSEKLKQYLNND
ncbi:MAG: RdgB/HAM1 family non-canonical purine NTP pyrophosphatase [Clostridia bacterium]|nr:RdgB/HAM1 family non-canonical purine NTP pyrophosphatase [Loktanella sp.]MBQ1951085.1 RdgB/HAM1 family non-canonical purine NTP pyrophosphatase [Clostridia bacterium]